ncbi:MAG: hypothetical protein J0L54_08325 [Chitinophagales bacterium]|nr:hypothetical protein [Chitinophagales bacterium]
MNLKLMFYQYLSPVFIFLMLGIGVIYLKKWSVLFIMLFGCWIIVYYRNWFYFLPFLPAALLALWGNIRKQKLALKIHLLIPAITLVTAGAEPVYRVSTRIKKHTGEAVIVTTGTGRIKWIQEGPGWGKASYNWYEAVRICRQLDSSGNRISDREQNIWRLPDIDEAVTSMHRHGSPAGGKWDQAAETAFYDRLPDKEFPMWRRHSPIIYWWTGTGPLSDTTYAWMISANGVVKKVKKKFKAGYYGFRAVTTLPDTK